MGGAESRGHPWLPPLAPKWSLFQRGSGRPPIVIASRLVPHFRIVCQTVAGLLPYATHLLPLSTVLCDPTAGTTRLCTSTMHRSCRQQACLPSADLSPDASTLLPRYSQQLAAHSLTPSAPQFIASELISKVLSRPTSFPLNRNSK